MDEMALAELHRQGRFSELVTDLVRHEGPHVFGYLMSLLRDRDLAEDAYSQLWLDVLRGLASFRRECTFRGYTYLLARHAAAAVRKRARLRSLREQPLDTDERLASIAQAVRTSTREWLRTENKQRIQALRAALDEEDQTLLALRVDRRMAFRDIAVALGVERTDEAALERASARLRQRFQTLKKTLRELAEREGLLASRPPA